MKAVLEHLEGQTLLVIHMQNKKIDDLVFPSYELHNQPLLCF